MALCDPHSYADDAQPSTRHLALSLRFDFDAKQVRGTVRLQLDGPAPGVLHLDTRDLKIHAVRDAAGQPCQFELAVSDPVLGARLSISTKSDAVEIDYNTSPNASALQWLEPAQTKGGAHPYVFTQCQAIHARSVFPCQDSPRVRATYEARLNIPAELVAVMAAATEGRKELGDGRAEASFRMPQPIPSYLFAFAVGNLASRELGTRSRVYSEPEVVEAAAWEFAEVDAVLSKAEELFGTYPWDRFDLLVMPPSFPYGGMENPRLTFLTPTLLAGDRSLVNVVAHELAHSWTGNLVTNANLDHFWLNEGFTVYAERRILEALEGVEAKSLHAALGRKGLEEDVARLTQKDPKLTRLENDLAGIDPDEVYSQVPYEKGYAFLARIEEVVGRPRFDKFLARYIERFRFESIVTSDFLELLKAELGDALGTLDVEGWLHGTGIPPDAPAARSDRLARLREIADGWKEGRRPDTAALAALDATEWQVMLTLLPQRLPADDCAWVEAEHQLSASKNYEILVSWLAIALRSGYAPALATAQATLHGVGRMKYLRPLYAAMLDAGEEGKKAATETFASASPGYHPVARGVIAGMLNRAAA